MIHSPAPDFRSVQVLHPCDALPEPLACWRGRQPPWRGKILVECKNIVVASTLACLMAGTTAGAEGPDRKDAKSDPAESSEAATPENAPAAASGDAPSEASTEDTTPEASGDAQAAPEENPPVASPLTTPEAKIIAAFNQSLLSLLESSGSFAARYAIIEPAVKKTFDLEFMAAKVLGRGWKELTPEQQAQWLTSFTRLTASNYAGRFVGEKGPSFENRGEQAGTHDTVVVLTKLIDPNGEDVELNYRMRETPSGWKVIDCYMNGTVSEIALRRSEYGSVLRRNGFEALLSAVDEKSAALATSPTP